jgi:RNA polymerase sigma-70 factor (ECF subfamily)
MYTVDFQGESIAADTTDVDVVNRILAGEKNRYAILVRKYNQRLYRVGIAIINDDMDVEDAMQSAYIKAYENLNKFSFKADFSTWLTRIFINECLSILRKRKHSAKLNGDMKDSEMHLQQATDTVTPAAKAMNAELKVILERAILELPEKYRTVFIMREIENMNIAETKACLEISGINVKVRLNRAKALLRKSLNQFYVKEDIFSFHLTRCNNIVTRVLQNIGA